MEITRKYENYPGWIVLLSNLVGLAIYTIGFLILIRIGIVFSFLYLLYIIALEFRLLRYHCTNCYYWGKTCGFGQGCLSSWFFKQGDAAKFCSKEMTWAGMIPDILVSVIPLVTGIVLIIIKFDLILLLELILIVLFTTSGNGLIRGKLTCSYCKQRELGCPAEALFKKKK